MYLIYGESFRLINDEIKKITKNNDNIVTFDMNEVSLSDILVEAKYVSMFNDEKIIIVKNANFFSSSKLNDSDTEEFINYIDNPVSQTLIIFTTYEKMDTRKKVTKLFKEKYKVIDVAKISIDDIFIKVQNYVKSQGFRISSETLKYIMNCCMNNYDLIVNEIEKIFLFYDKPCEIKLDDVKEIVARNLEDNNFKFIEAVIQKNMSKSLQILNDLYVQKVDPIILLNLLAREYRLMISCMTMLEDGYRKNNISNELNLQDWQVDKIIKNFSNYYISDLKDYIIKLADIDLKIKKGEYDRFNAMKYFLSNVFEN